MSSSLSQPNATYLWFQALPSLLPSPCGTCPITGSSIFMLPSKHPLCGSSDFLVVLCVSLPESLSGLQSNEVLWATLEGLVTRVCRKMLAKLKSSEWCKASNDSIRGPMLVVENLPANAGDIRDAGSIPGWGRSPGGAHGNPLQYSCLENPMDRGDRRIGSQRVRHNCSDLAQHTQMSYGLFVFKEINVWGSLLSSESEGDLLEGESNAEGLGGSAIKQPWGVSVISLQGSSPGIWIKSPMSHFCDSQLLSFLQSIYIFLVM